MLTTILGAGGPIGDELAKILVAKNALSSVMRPTVSPVFPAAVLTGAANCPAIWGIPVEGPHLCRISYSRG